MFPNVIFWQTSVVNICNCRKCYRSVLYWKASIFCYISNDILLTKIVTDTFKICWQI